jgi:hypothetical protein
MRDGAGVPGRRPTALTGALGFLALATGLVLALVAPAAAHDDKGILTVERAGSNGSGGVELVVLLRYSGDKEPVSTAEVSATADGPGGQVGPVPLIRTDVAGQYAGTLVLSAAGGWTIHIASPKPVASLDHPYVLVAPTTTTSTTAVTTTTGGPSSDDGGEDDGASGTSVLVAGVGAGAVVVVGGVALFRRLRSR